MKNITFTPIAYKDYLEWLQTDKKIFLKIAELIKDIAKDPEHGRGKPEMLKHEYQGLWSKKNKSGASISLLNHR